MKLAGSGALAALRTPAAWRGVLLLAGALAFLVPLVSGPSDSAFAQAVLSPSSKLPSNPPGFQEESPLTTPQEIEASLKKALKVEQTGSNLFRIGKVELDKEKRTVSLTGRVCLRTQVIEYALVIDKGKAYESLLTTEAAPMDLHLAFVLLGAGEAEVGGKLGEALAVPATNAVGIELKWSDTNGQPVQHSLAELIVLATNLPANSGNPMVLQKWLYNGSVFDAWGFAAQREGSIVSLIRDPVALINNPSGDRDNDNIHFPNPKLLPAEGWPVRIIFQLPEHSNARMPSDSQALAPPIAPLSVPRK